MSSHLIDVWTDVTSGLSADEKFRAQSLLLGHMFAHLNSTLLRDDVVRDMRAAVDSTINARRVSAMDLSGGRWSA